MPASVIGREGKGTQSHFKVHFWGDLETGVTVNRYELTPKEQTHTYKGK